MIVSQLADHNQRPSSSCPSLSSLCPFDSPSLSLQESEEEEEEEEDGDGEGVEDFLDSR